MRCFAMFVLLLLATVGVAPAQTQQSVKIPGGGRISILVPPGYSFRVERDTEDNAAVFMENPVWPINITAFIIAERDPAITTAEWQQNQLISRVADALPQAKEQDYNFQTLHPSSGTGVFCVFTDSTYKKPQDLPLGEFLNLTGGVKAWRGCFVFFQIMSNGTTSSEYQEAFQLCEKSFTK
jgi:hypothetical protein